MPELATRSRTGCWGLAVSRRVSRSHRRGGNWGRSSFGGLSRTSPEGRRVDRRQTQDVRVFGGQRLFRSSRHIRDSAPHVDDRRRARALHRVRERRESAPCPRHRSRPGDGGAAGPRRGSGPPRPPTIDRGRRALDGERRRWSAGRSRSKPVVDHARGRRRDDERRGRRAESNSIGLYACCLGHRRCSVGLAPALHATRIDLATSMRAGAQAVTGSAPGVRGRRRPLGSLLIVGQVSLSVVLLVGAAILTRSLSNLQSVDVGFDRDHLVIADLDINARGYVGTPLANLVHELRARVAAIPGVRGTPPSLKTGSSRGAIHARRSRFRVSRHAPPTIR